MIPSRPHRPNPRGFSLIELLVVIGIIGILTALIVAAVSKVRARANDLACAANLRQIGTLAQNWAANHQGFLPLDGEVEISPLASGWGGLAPALGDSARRRYAYHYDRRDPSPPVTLERPMPFAVALIASTVSGGGDAVQLRPDHKWSLMEQRYPQARIFRCPAAVPIRYKGDYAGRHTGVFEGGPSLYLTIGGFTDATIWYVDTDYATNGGLLGYHYDRRFDHRRYRGHLSRVSNASTMVLCGDTGGPAPGWVPRAQVEQTSLTLADVLQNNLYQFRFASPLDPYRHRNRMNVLFADGHVAMIDLEHDALAQCQMLQP